jgi:hypothetical protein
MIQYLNKKESAMHQAMSLGLNNLKPLPAIVVLILKAYFQSNLLCLVDKVLKKIYTQIS